MKKRAMLLVAMCGLGGVSTAAQGDIIAFNPSGLGTGAGNITNVGAFDWKVGNSLAVGAIPTNGPLQGPTVFTQLFQASLAVFNDSAGQKIDVPAGLEITVVLGFEATATNFPPVVLGYSAVPSLPNFVKVFVDSTPDANDLLGTGFNDGVEVLSGHISRALGSIILDTNPASAQQFDQFNTDNYSGKQTATGIGSLSVTAAVDFYLPNYFTVAPRYLSLSFSNTSTALPYLQTDPSQKFWDGTSLISPNLNTINGIADALNVNGAKTDIQLQADANSSFNLTTVPSPAAMPSVLMLMGGLAMARLRRRGK